MKKKLLFALVASSLLSFSTVAFADNYIEDITYARASKPEDAQNALTSKGYNYVNLDVNHGFGGAYEYIGYKETVDPKEACTDIRVITSDKALALNSTVWDDDSNHKYTFTIRTGDLNEGLGGSYTYLATTHFPYAKTNNPHGGPGYYLQGIGIYSAYGDTAGGNYRTYHSFSTGEYLDGVTTGALPEGFYYDHTGVHNVHSFVGDMWSEWLVEGAEDIHKGMHVLGQTHAAYCKSATHLLIKFKKVAGAQLD